MSDPRRGETENLTQPPRTEQVCEDALVRVTDVLESISDAFVACDVNWRYTYVNDHACRMLRKSREELLGSQLWQVFPEARQSPFFDALAETMRTGVPQQVEAFYPPLDAWFNCRCYPARDGISVFFHDVTARVEAEQALQELNATLESRVQERTALAEERAEHLRRAAAELSQAEQRERERLSQVLHEELQQLLLAARLRLAGVCTEADAAVQTQIQAVDQLLGESMSLSRSLTVELSPPILERGTTEAAFEWLGRWFAEKYGFEVRVSPEDELPPLPQHLRVFLFHAAREMLLNAVKHSGAREAMVLLGWHDRCVWLQVEDAGRGFDPDAIREKMDRAQSLGLFSIRERAELLQGRLEIEATAAGGGCFRLVVPHAAEEPAAPPADPLAAETQSREKPDADQSVLRLLVADDHRIVREGMVLALNAQQGFCVVGEAGDGREAIRQAKDLEPDVIIMDVAMPALDGIAATRRIKRRQPGVTVVGLTMHEEEEIAEKILSAGAAACLCKHRPVSDLVKAIQKLHAER